MQVYVVLLDHYHRDNFYGNEWQGTSVCEVFAKRKDAKAYVDSQIRKMRREASGENDEFELGPMLFMSDQAPYAGARSRVRLGERDGAVWDDTYINEWRIVRRVVERGGKRP